MCGSGNDVFVINHPVGWPLVYLWVGCPSKGICFAVCLALDKLDPIVELLEFDCLLGLLRSVGAHCRRVLKVPVIRMYFDLVLSAS
jgi:hypothetical protein